MLCAASQEHSLHLSVSEHNPITTQLNMHGRQLHHLVFVNIMLWGTVCALVSRANLRTASLDVWDFPACHNWRIE